MWKLIVILIIILLLDVKDLSIREKRREFVIYIVLHLIVLGVGFYNQSPTQVSLADFILNISTP